MLGVAKSHATLPFGGADLETYLRLPAGHRSPVFAAGVAARGAGLLPGRSACGPGKGKDLLHGLIRVEAAASPSTVGRGRPDLPLAAGGAGAGQRARSPLGPAAVRRSASGGGVSPGERRTVTRCPHRPRGRDRAQAVAPRTSSTSGPRASPPSGSGPSCGSRRAGPRRCYGVVTDGFAYSDLRHAAARRDRRRRRPGAAAHEPTAARRDPALSPPRCCARSPRSRCSRCRSGAVHLAGDADVALALRMDAYTARASGRPASRSGVYAAGRARGAGLPRRRLPARPRGGAPQHHRRLRPRHQDQRGRVPAGEHLPDLPGAQGQRRRGLLQREGARPLLPRPAGRARRRGPTARTSGWACAAEPFDDVRYYAPVQGRRREPQHAAHPRGARGTTPSRWSGACARCWTTPRCCSTATTSMPRPTRSSISSAERVVGAEFTRRHAARQAVRGAELRRPRGVLPRASSTSWRRWASGGEVWRTHHIATIRKVRNRLGNISTRAKGLVTDDGAASDLPWGAFEDRSVHVVDVAGLDPLAQDLVFARVRLQAAGAPRAARPGRGSRRGVRGRAQQVRPGRRARTPTSGRCCSTSPSAAATSAWCSSRPSSSAPRCSAAWSATPAPRSSAAWTWTSWRRRATPRSRPPPRSSWPRCPRAS